MGVLDNLRSALSKIRIASTGSTKAVAQQIPVIPGMGAVTVVDTMNPPTNMNVPGSWSRSWLGPGQPFTISETSARAKDAETEPRSFQYVSSVNSTLSPRLAYGLMAFSDLRDYAENVPEVAMCVRILTEELKAFVPTIVDMEERKVEDPSLKWMIEHPDGFNPWPVWLSRFLYNVLVYDAGCTYLIRNSRKKVTATRVIDGSTIFVVVDEQGEQPRPPAPAFQQIIWGTPKMFMNTYQLWYKPRHLRADAPYGRSPIEDALPAIKLLRHLWDYEYEKYSIGNIPEMVFTVPENWKENADQILEYEEAFNARMSGSNDERVRARFLPFGMSVLQTKELNFNKESYDAATNSVRMAYGILQSEVGDAPSGGLGGTGYAEAMQSAFYRMGLAPLKSYVESHFNDILRMNSIDNRKFELEFPPESLDPQKEEEKFSTRFQIGGITRDEYRQGLGMKVMGGEEGKFIVNPGGGGEGEEGDGFGGLGGDGKTPPKPGMVNVGNKNNVQVRRPVTVAKSPVGVVKKPVGVVKKGISFTKFDAGFVDMAQRLGYDGDMDALQEGLDEEHEHADTVGGDEETMMRIAIDHLKEDGDYYRKLKQMMAKFSKAVLTKACGVSADDDMYYASKIQIRTEVEMPAQGANESLIVSIGGGELAPRPAVWKPETGEKDDLRDWVGGKLFCRAEACYLLDRELARTENEYLVPVTFTAEIDGVAGSVQHYVQDRESRQEVTTYGDAWVERAAVLDYITGQVDRNRKNWLTHPHDDKRPVLIDSDLSFPVDPNQPLHSSFIDAWAGKELSENSMDMLYLVLGNHDLWADLKDVLDSDEAVDNALARAQQIYELGMIPIVNTVEVVNGSEASSPRMIRVVRHDVSDESLKKAWDAQKHPKDKEGKFTFKHGGTAGGAGEAPEAGEGGGAKPKKQPKKWSSEASEWEDYIQNGEGDVNERLSYLANDATFGAQYNWIKAAGDYDAQKVRRQLLQGAYTYEKDIIKHGQEALSAEGFKKRDLTPEACYRYMKGYWSIEDVKDHLHDVHETDTEYKDEVEPPAEPPQQAEQPQEVEQPQEPQVEPKAFTPKYTWDSKVGANNYYVESMKARNYIGDTAIAQKTQYGSVFGVFSDSNTGKAWNMQFDSMEEAQQYGEWYLDGLLPKVVPPAKKTGYGYFTFIPFNTEFGGQSLEAAIIENYGTTSVAIYDPDHYNKNNLFPMGSEQEAMKFVMRVAAGDLKVDLKISKPGTPKKPKATKTYETKLGATGELDGNSDVMQAIQNIPENMRNRYQVKQAIENLPSTKIEKAINDAVDDIQNKNGYGVDTSKEMKKKVCGTLASITGMKAWVIGSLVHCWAQSSNDEHEVSLAIQRKFGEMFGCGVSEWQKKKFAHYNLDEPTVQVDKYVFKNAPESYHQFTDAEITSFCHAIYDVTQDRLAKMGYSPDDRITLYRGYTFTKHTDDQQEIDEWMNLQYGDTIHYQGNAVESFAYEISSATNFGQGDVIAISVPIKNIVSTALTGLGCLSEHEVCVVGNIDIKGTVVRHPHLS